MRDRRKEGYIDLRKFRSLLKEFDDKYHNFWDKIFGGWPGVDQLRDFLAKRDFLNVISDTWIDEFIPIVLHVECRRNKLKNSPVDRLFQNIKKSLFATSKMDQNFLDHFVALENAGIHITSRLILNFFDKRNNKRYLKLFAIGLMHIKSLNPRFEIENILDALGHIISTLISFSDNRVRFGNGVSEDFVKMLCEACSYKSINNFMYFCRFLNHDHVGQILITEESVNMVCELMRKDPGNFRNQLYNHLLRLEFHVSSDECMYLGEFSELDTYAKEFHELMEAYRKRLKDWQKISPLISAARANSGNPLLRSSIPLMHFTVQQYLHGGIKHEVAPDAEIKNTSTDANLSPKTKPAKPLFFASVPGLDAKSECNEMLDSHHASVLLAGMTYRRE